MQTVQHWLDHHHFLQGLVEFADVPWMKLNHHWHGINVLSVLECALLASCLCMLLALFALRKSKRLAILSVVGALSFATAAYAANTALSALSASGALAGANLIYVVQTAGVGGVKATFTQVATFINSLFSGDFTCTSGGACTLKNTGPGATGPIGSGTVAPIVTTDAQGRVTALTGATITPSISNVTGMGANVPAALLLSLSANGGLTSTIAGGTAVLGTSAIASGACATVVTATATGTAATDVVTASFNGDPTAVTGYIPSTSGMLSIIGYPTTNAANFKVCNNTVGSITPGAITLNWRVVR